MPEPLAILLGGRHAATLRQGNGFTITYEPEYLADPEATPLSLSMPLTDRPATNKTVVAWINGILPADWKVRERIAQLHGIKTTNVAALVGAIGLDCPGSVQVLPLDRAGEADPRYAVLEPVGEDELGRRLAALRKDEAGWQIADERWSIGGGQSKFTLTRTEDGWAYPLGPAASTHIVKPGVAGARDQALNEHLCLDALTRAGLIAARSQYVEFGGNPAIVVRRFDRSGIGHGVKRRHAEDLCQALRHNFAYESDGGPTSREIVDLLTNAVGGSSPSRFRDALMAASLLGSPDGHARNYSLLLDGKEVTLAPLYDVASSLPYDVEGEGIMHQRRLAMAIAGERQFARIEPQHWSRWLAGNGYDVDEGLDRLLHLAGVLPDAMSSAVSACGRPAEGIGRRLVDRVAESCQRAAAAAADAGRASLLGTPLTNVTDSEQAARGRVWVDKHARRGRLVQGHWRNVPR